MIKHRGRLWQRIPVQEGAARRTTVIAPAGPLALRCCHCSSRFSPERHDDQQENRHAMCIFTHIRFRRYWSFFSLWFYWVISFVSVGCAAASLRWWPPRKPRFPTAPGVRTSSPAPQVPHPSAQCSCSGPELDTTDRQNKGYLNLLTK